MIIKFKGIIGEYDKVEQNSFLYNGKPHYEGFLRGIPLIMMFHGVNKRNLITHFKQAVNCWVSINDNKPV